ncbi:MAG: DUF6449 domain-containing protein [Lachnospiraceae bacterium]|nr:DUF6449 domain-containing protein [Lachnospiraceae bacterium]
MTSKKYYLDRMKENARRRLTTWVMMIISFLMVFPLVAICGAEMMRNDLTAKNYRREMVEFFKMVLGANPMLCLAVMACGLIAGFMAFIYLHGRDKVDMYGSIPESAKARFVKIYAVTAIGFAVIYGVMAFVALLIGLAYGGISGGVLLVAFCNFIEMFLIFMAYFSIAALAVLLTGRPAIAVCGTLVFMGYEFVVRFLAMLYLESFFKTIYSASEMMFGDQLYTAPIYNALSSSAERIDAGHTLQYINYQGMLRAFILFVVVTGIVYYSYRKRASEAAGNSVAFPALKAWLKLFVLIPFSLLVLIASYGMFEKFGVSTILLTVVVVAIAGGFIEAMFQSDIKAIVKKPHHTIIALVVTGIVFVIFKQDLFGVDTYIPKESSFESAGLYLYDMDDSYKDGSAIMKDMKIKDYDLVREIAENNVTDNEALEDGDFGNRCAVEYRLKNGRCVRREYCLMAKEAQKIYKTLLGMPEYWKGIHDCLNADSLDNATEYGWTLDSQFADDYESEDKKLSKKNTEETAQLLEAYLEDVNHLDPEKLLSERELDPVYIMYKDDESTQYERLPITPSFQNTIAFLEGHGYAGKMQKALEEPSKAIKDIYIYPEYSEEDEVYVIQDEAAIKEIYEAHPELFVSSGFAYNYKQMGMAPDGEYNQDTVIRSPMNVSITYKNMESDSVEISAEEFEKYFKKYATLSE